jgi:hypothetical protein
MFAILHAPGMFVANLFLAGVCTENLMRID